MDEKKTAASPSAETMIERAVEESVSRAVFSSGIQRREFMRLLGGAGALAALNSVFPLDAAKAQYQSAQAVVVQSQAALSQTQVNLEHTVITAPIDGIVTSRSVDVGQTVAASLQSPAACRRHLCIRVSRYHPNCIGLGKLPRPTG